jgi:hypothetical protein
MTHSSRRLAVMLGAGVSRDAGLPLTNQLASDVLRALNQKSSTLSKRPRWLSALNFAYAAIASYQARDGGDPLQGVNIERLISALRLLADRENHEAAPFVQAWRDPVLPGGRVVSEEETSRRLVENIGQALGGDRRVASDSRHAAINVGYYVAEIAQYAKIPVRRNDYREADSQVLSLLGSLLKIEQAVDYLYPLVDIANTQADGLDIISLNYDLAVEQAAVARGVRIQRGIGVWPDLPITFERSDQSLRLHKIHGSLDWRVEQRVGFGAPRVSVASEIAPEPWIVVGDREKLATEGPTLELLNGARIALEQADHLVIAGYGFGDAHVNSMIRDWLSRESSRTVGIVDPSWPYPDTRTFRGWLLHTYGDAADINSRPPVNRIQPFQGGAKAVLAEALSLRRPVPAKDIVLIAKTIESGDSGFAVTLEIRGGSLSDVRFINSRSSPVRIIGDVHMLQRLRRDESGGERIENWIEGEQVQVRVHSPFGPPTIHLHGRTLTSSVQLSVSVEENGS